MKKIAYYISDYGFGHATRSAAIIKELLNNDDKIRIEIITSFSLSFLREVFMDSRVTFREASTDIGYVLQENSLEPDIQCLNEKFDRYMGEWESRIHTELTYLAQNKIDLVLSDIYPAPFPAAKKLGIPTIGLSNFTWYTAYKELLEEHKLAKLKSAYNEMTYFLALAGENEPPWKAEKISYGFFSRDVDFEEVQRIQHMLNPMGARKLIFFGLGMKIGHYALDELDIWNQNNITFIVSSNTKIQGGNIYRIPRSYTNVQHFIAASDLVVSKAGWGTVSEAISSGTPTLIISRSNMVEDRNTTDYLKQHTLCRTIAWEELKHLHLDDRFFEYSPSAKNRNEDCKHLIVKDILDILYS